jgi:hypothetical protein
MISGGYQCPTFYYHQLKINLCFTYRINFNQNLPIIVEMISHLHTILLS